MSTHDTSPPQEAARLGALIGQWAVEGIFATDGSESAVSGTWTFERAASGWGVLGSLSTEIEGIGAFGEIEVLGFDTMEQAVHLFSMNMLAIRDHKGGWVDDHTLSVRYTGLQGSEPVVEDITIELSGPDRIVGHVVERLGGAIVATTELTMTRSG